MCSGIWNGGAPDLEYRRVELPDLVLREWPRLSLLSWGISHPNPPVACVISTQAGRIYTGATERAGGRHAEVVALDAYDRARDTSPFEMFVTLEPCSRFGRTPPCLDRILRYPQLRRLVYGNRDPGQPGALERIAALCPVEAAAGDHNFFLQGFLQRIQHGEPRLFFKVALSADGFMGQDGQRVDISGPVARAFTQLLRSRMSGIAVGPATVRADLPLLNYRPPESWQASAMVPLQPLAWLEVFRAEGTHILGQPAELLQPDRILTLGRSGWPAGPLTWKDYLGLQRALPGQQRWIDFGGTDALSGLPAENPPARIPFSAAAIRSTLAQWEHNDVMIEGGAELLSLFGENMRSSDVCLLIQSQIRRLGTGIRPPAFLLSGPEMGRYRLGSDELIVRQPG